jgi:hypothetical protein
MTVARSPLAKLPSSSTERKIFKGEFSSFSFFPRASSVTEAPHYQGIPLLRGKEGERHADCTDEGLQVKDIAFTTIALVFW